MEEPRRLGGRYELGQVLGRGGMAEVYLAHDTRLGRTVAVKTLRVDLARDPSFQARFRREAQSAASLNHPAIVAVYDTGEDYVDQVSIPYIVMEYVDGSTLRELLHSGRKLLPERAMEMTIGILQALEYSHRSGIVHRDIKPANVMLTRTGQVKVMDFGIARAMGDSGMTMTQTSAVIGTAQYLSPEQAKGESVDARSDLYSTGCLLYELLTVRPPFVGDSPVAVAYQHVREEASPPSTYDHEITPEMDAIVLKALVKDPDYRYQSADEMRADIEALLDGRPVAATASMGAAGYGGGHPDDQQTAMLRRATPGGNGQQTSMLPPVNPDDDGYGYDERHDRRRPKKSNTSTILLVVAGLLVLVGAILIGKWITSENSGDGQVQVPKLVGQPIEDARRSATNVDLELEETKKPCEDQAEGHVCEQNPEGGSVDKGTTIEVVVSTGAPKVSVPDVTDLTYEQAKQDLKDKGFSNVTRKTEESDEEPNTVLSQDPKGGSRAEKGTEVTLTVAKERDTSSVPNVTGKTCEEATVQLKANDLVAECTEVENPAEAGKVFEQTPGANEEVDPGTTVTLKIAKAPEAEFALPPVTGKSLKDAKAELEALGLTVVVQPGMPDKPKATVIGSTPGAGQPVKKGTSVTLQTVGGDDGGGFIGGGD